MNEVAQASGGDIWQIVQTGGVIGVMAVALWMFITGKIHSNKEFDALTQDRDFYRVMALRAATAAESSVTVAEKVVNVAENTSASGVSDATLMAAAHKRGLIGRDT